METRFTSQTTADAIAELEKDNTFVSQEIFWNRKNDCGIMLVNDRKQVYMIYQILSVSHSDCDGLMKDEYLRLAKKFYNRAERIAKEQGLIMWSY
jgi:hypothetical protein